MSLEVVMTTAVMVPVAFLTLVFGIRLSTYLYRAIAALVGWPFL